MNDDDIDDTMRRGERRISRDVAGNDVSEPRAAAAAATDSANDADGAATNFGESDSRTDGRPPSDDAAVGDVASS